MEWLLYVYVSYSIQKVQKNKDIIYYLKISLSTVSCLICCLFDQSSNSQYTFAHFTHKQYILVTVNKYELMTLKNFYLYKTRKNQEGKVNFKWAF